MHDFLGTNLGPGDKVIYASRNGSTVRLSKGIVIGETSDGKKLRVIRTDYSDIVDGNHEKPDLLVVIGSIPIVSLEPLVEAVAAKKNAERGYYATNQTVTVDELLEMRRIAVRLFNEIWGE